MSHFQDKKLSAAQQNKGVRKLAATITGFNAYQIKGLEIPPVGINNNVNPIVSVNTISLKTLSLSTYLFCKSVNIQAATTSAATTRTLKINGDCGPSKKKNDVNTSELYRNNSTNRILLDGLLLN